MATITANLNAGDGITPDNELIFKIYGDADAYTTAIATTGSAINDANVSINAGVLTIANVNAGASENLKITAIDASGNESLQSNAFASSVNPFLDAAVVLDLNDRGFGNVEVATLRESGGNLQQNFTALEMANGTAQAFTGANDGFVELLDHTGNNHDALQTIVGEQPKAIDSGNLITNNTKLVSLFNGVEDNLESNYSYNNVLTIAMKVKILSVKNFGSLFQGGTSDTYLFRDASTNNYRFGNGINNGTVVASVGNTPIDVKIFVVRGTTNQVWMNGNTSGTFAGVLPSFLSMTIGSIIPDRSANMYLESFMAWNTDKSADRIEIENAL